MKHFSTLFGSLLIFALILTLPIFLILSFFLYALHPANSWTIGEKPIWQLTVFLVYLLVLGCYALVKWKILSVAIKLIQKKKIEENKFWGIVMSILALVVLSLGVNNIIIRSLYPLTKEEVGAAVYYTFQFSWLIILFAFYEYALPAMMYFGLGKKIASR